MRDHTKCDYLRKALKDLNLDPGRVTCKNTRSAWHDPCTVYIGSPDDMIYDKVMQAVHLANWCHECDSGHLCDSPHASLYAHPKYTGPSKLVKA